ncbi:MAG: LysM peptidoglycan-binding domain-containing protein [Bryobacteraceae bacterium]|nr:LysM peptidoglycan-binding domain-containing protein [Bryobacteraceae bacterium]
MADNDQLLNQLKGKYQSVISAAPQMGIHLQNVHVEGGKLLIRGTAPNDQVKNQLWDKIKQVDPGYSDLTVDVSIDSSLPQPAAASSGTSSSGGRKYTVQSGDSLSKIAKQFYGDAGDYMKIFDANKGTLSDPDKIHPGQELVIP